MRTVRTVRNDGIRGVSERLDGIYVRLDRLEVRFASFGEYMKEQNLLWKEERREMEARIAADRRETAERLAADRQETAERLAADRIDSQNRLERELKEFNSQKRWLKANFVGIVAIIIGFFLAMANGNLPF